jgi:hypothetical protein
MDARHGTREPDAGKDLLRPVVLDERESRRRVVRARLEREVRVAAIATRPAPEEAAPDVDPRQRVRRALGNVLAQGQQATRVIRVVVAEHDLRNLGKVDLQLARVLEDGVRPRARVEQDPMAVHLDDRSETPFADAFVREHGGEDLDLEGMDAARRRRRRRRRDTGG